jgi:hypothetical protein
MRSTFWQHTVLEVRLYMSSNADRWTDNDTVTIATVWQHNTPFEPCTGSVCVLKWRHWVVFPVDEENFVPSLDALKTSCEALFGVDPPAG